MSAIPFPYEASPPTTDPAKLLREAQIENRELRRIIAEQDAELANREAHITELTQELAATSL